MVVILAQLLHWSAKNCGVSPHYFRQLSLTILYYPFIVK